MRAIFAIAGMIFLNFAANLILSIISSLPFEIREITSSAMLPTLKINDLLFVEKFSPYLNQPFKRGEIVLFYPEFLNPKEKNSWQKMLLALARINGQTGETAHFRRVAGLPGDLVEIYAPEAKIVLPPNVISNQTTPSKGGEVIKITLHQNENSKSDQKCIGRYLVPEKFVFLIGDNTEYLGILEDVKIFGRPQFKVSDFAKIEPQGTTSFVISKGGRLQ